MEKHIRKKVGAEVLKRLRLGDETAFEYLYWNYNSYIFNFINSLLHDRTLAEDLTQNVFLKIWEKRENIEPEQGLDAYLFTIARNLVYKETENKLKFVYQSGMSDEVFHSPDILTEENIDAVSLQEYIDILVEQLPAARKEIFLLSRRQQLSNREIAQRLSISEKTVENQITNTLRFLKKKLSEDNSLAVVLLLIVKYF